MLKSALIEYDVPLRRVEGDGEMRKRPPKRRIIARFMQGKWVNEWDMVRHDLDYRLGWLGCEFNELRHTVRRNAAAAAALKETDR